MEITPQSAQGLAQLEGAFRNDPHVKKLIALKTRKMPLPASWLTHGTSYTYPPAFIPILHDTSGTAYGAWIHPNTARSPCFVGIAAEDPSAKEIARDVRQFWTFLALLSITIDSKHTPELETFMDGFEITAESIVETSIIVGDNRDMFGAHPVFSNNCPSFLRNGRPLDSAFPSLARRETWRLACRYEIEVSDPTAPRWLRDPTIRTFRDEVSAHSWAGAWFALNAPGWELNDALTAADEMVSAFPELDTTAILDWSLEASRFSMGY